MKIAIIGCGKQSGKHIVGLRSTAEKFEIVVYDTKISAAEQIAKIYDVKVAKSLEDILNDLTVKAVIVATPTPTHYDLISRIIKSDKDVFCEKPLCETYEQAQNLFSLSVSTGKIIQVGYVYRYVPALKSLKAILTLDKNPLGQPVHAIFRIGGRGDHALWKHKKAFGGGAFNEMLVHMLDLGCWFFGEIKKINHYEEKILRPKRYINGEEIEADAEDFLLLSAETLAGIHLTFQADLTTPAFRQYVEVQGSNGSFIGSIQPEIPSSLNLVSPIDDFNAGNTNLAFNTINLFDSQMQNFLNNIRDNSSVDYPSVSDTINLFNVIKKINKKNSSLLSLHNIENFVVS